VDNPDWRQFQKTTSSPSKSWFLKAGISYGPLATDQATKQKTMKALPFSKGIRPSWSFSVRYFGRKLKHSTKWSLQETCKRIKLNPSLNGFSHHLILLFYSTLSCKVPAWLYNFFEKSSCAFVLPGKITELETPSTPEALLLALTAR